MGRLVNPDSIIDTSAGSSFSSTTIQNNVEANIKKLITNSASQFTRQLEEKPNFVTYYHLSKPQSTFDKGLENVEKYIGHHSPMKYYKINNFPLYGISQMSIDLDSNNGLELENYATEGTVLPDTINPLPGDLISFPYIGEEYLFTVTKVTFDQIKAKPFWKIELLLLYKKRLEDFIDSIIEEYNFIFENIGTDNKAILQKTTFNNITFAQAIYEALLKKFIDNFFVKQLNCFLVDLVGSERPVYNSYLTKFLIDNQLLKFKREFLNSIYIEHILPLDYNFRISYDSSPYKMMEMRDPELKVERNKFLFQPINLRENPLDMYGKHCVSAVLVGNNNAEGKTIWNMEFLDHIKSNTLFSKGNKSNFLLNFFIEYLNGVNIISDYDNLTRLNEMNFYDDYVSYINIPFILKAISTCIGQETKSWNVQSLV